MKTKIENENEWVVWYNGQMMMMMMLLLLVNCCVVVTSR